MNAIGLVGNPSDIEHLGNSLKKALQHAPKRRILRIAVAYISPAGINSIEKSLKSFLNNNGTVEIIAGIDIGKSPVKGIQRLVKICGPGSVFVFWHPKGYTFHPKLYCLSDLNMTKGFIWIGSANLTANGLLNNYECGVQLKATDTPGQVLGKQISEYFVELRKSPHCQPATNELIEQLLKLEKSRTQKDEDYKPRRVPTKLINRFKVPVQKPLDSGFVMLLSHNDVSGRRFEPYFLIPVRAREEKPSFWGWQRHFHPSPRSGMPERKISVNIYIGDKVISESRRIYWVAGRDEFRFVSPLIYNLGRLFAGSLLYVSKAKKGYDIHVIKQKDPRFAPLVKHAVNLSSHQKKWGYI